MDSMRILLTGVLVCTLAATACGADEAAGAGGASKSAFDKPTLENYVRYMLMWGPQINVTVSDPLPSALPGLKEVTVEGTAGAASRQIVLLVSEDGKKIAQASVFDIAENPFQKDLDKITTVMTPAMGAASAPVSLVLFSDYQCAYCRQQSEALRQNLLKSFPDQARLYFKDFPLESIHPWAKEAAMAGRCIYKQSEEVFWGYHDFMYAHQAEITEANLKSKITEFTQGNSGLDALQLGRCIDERLTEKDVDESIAEGQALQINSTPTLFINGRRFAGSLPWDNIKQIIDFEIQNIDLLGGADEDCCSVELPTPLTQ